MPFVVDTSKVTLNTDGAYLNSKGDAQCVAFVQMATLIGGGSVPGTSQWRKGNYVKDLTANQIAKGTVIATFDENNLYPGDPRHAAVYISHNNIGITVYDQWKSRPQVKQRVLIYRESEVRQVDNGNWFWIVETEATVGLGLTEPQHQRMFCGPLGLLE